MLNQTILLLTILVSVERAIVGSVKSVVDGQSLAKDGIEYDACTIMYRADDVRAGKVRLPRDQCSSLPIAFLVQKCTLWRRKLLFVGYSF